MKYKKRHYKRLLKKIRKDFDIHVKERKKDWSIASSNGWIKNSQSITIGIYGKWYKIIGALVHEFGHCNSILKNKNIKMGTAMLYRLKAPLTKKQKKDIFAEEKRAWKYGFKLMKDLNIEVDKKLLKFKNNCLRSHIKNLSA